MPERSWINPPGNRRQLVGLMGQVALAREAGFTIPHTLATGDMGDVVETFPDGAVHKSSPRIVFSEDGPRITQATHIRDITALPLDQLDPLTSYWQDHIEGRAWHAMAIGDQIFSVYWHTRGRPIGSYVPGPLPAEVQEQCRNYLRIAELGMGAFSLVEHDSGITFVGFNPDGHPGWLEGTFGMPISATIAQRLATIAMRDY